jgi:valyl-tRNA synthetase
MSTELPSNPPDLSKGYDPAAVEARWYSFWEENQFFEPDVHSSKPAFTITMPPPNVTGSLHMGHALYTLEDVLIRWKRMSGFNALWVPGTDHAGIATQILVERELKEKEKKNRHDIGREEFLKRVWDWKARSGGRIHEQFRVMGFSCAWSYHKFTMDEGPSRAVTEAFVRLYEDGLLYRANRMINWCPTDRTALSDLEVDREEGFKGELFSFAYPLADGGGEIVVATTRPETMLGDTAIAVHPDDPRYQHLIGKNVKHPITGREFPIIGDAILVDMTFGSGAVKVTPAHDPNDFATGQRHKLQSINIMNPDGTLNDEGGPFKGLKMAEARKAVKLKLDELALARGTKDNIMALGRCQRCKAVVEPYLSTQWFVKIEPLAQKAIAAVEEGRTRFVPESWSNMYFGWMRDIHDWCVSRQLWWGHQIPAWFVEGTEEFFVARTEDEAYAQAKAKHGEGVKLRRESDVLDTWFSSGLWPFSTLGWPDKTDALSTFYPTNVMETGFDIIFFWVARMMMFGIHFLGDVPFRDVYLHGMVRDKKGDKMSKMKGNVIDPLHIVQGASGETITRDSKELAKEYPNGLAPQGADALRLTLTAMATQGRDIKLDMKRVEGYRTFANKLWNATRFALEKPPNSPRANLDGYDAAVAAKATPSDADKWILARTRTATEEVVRALEEYRFADYANIVYQYVWGDLCDWYIELSKPAFYGTDENARAAAQYALVTALDAAFRLLHPIMPYVTEELWQRLPSAVHTAKSISIAPFPKAIDFPADEAIEKAFAPILKAIEGLRSFRGTMGVPFSIAIAAQVHPVDAATKAAFSRYGVLVTRLSNATLQIVDGPPANEPHAVIDSVTFDIRVPLKGLVDLDKEKARAQKELATVEGDLGKLMVRLENPAFLSKASAEAIEEAQGQAADLRKRQATLTQHLKNLG